MLTQGSHVTEVLDSLARMPRNEPTDSHPALWQRASFRCVMQVAAREMGLGGGTVFVDESRIHRTCIFRVKRRDHHPDSPPGNRVSREPPHVCVTVEEEGRVAAHVSPREVNEGAQGAECRRKRERRAIFRPRARKGGPSARGSGALFARKFQPWETRHRTFNKTRRASSSPLHPSSLSTTTSRRNRAPQARRCSSYFYLQPHILHLAEHPWPVPSKLPASPLVVRPPVSSSPPRPPGRRRRRLPPAVSRSLTASGPERSPSVKFGATRSPLSFSSASSPSSVSFVRSPRISRPISASSPLLSWPFRRPLRLTSSLSSRTPTWLPSTLSVSPSSPRISLSLVASAVRGLKRM